MKCISSKAMQFQIDLPEWAIRDQTAMPSHIPSPMDQMQAVLQFARRNVEQQTGGPFAAGVFERDSGRRIIIGVNRVVPMNVSSAHAEIVALSIAQQMLGCWDLGSRQLQAMQLVVNWRPCAMCYGAVLWSGVRSLIIAGSDDACEKITGFDEGPIHPEWRSELERRGVHVVDKVLYDEAIRVFEFFRNSGATVYNGRSM
jgi:tRNA(Arg) A34 adenosine deaminase TadA